MVNFSKKTPYYAIVFIALWTVGALSATQVIPNQVSPQIGENLWQMNYRQSITIDDILDTTTLCCNCDFFITQADIDGNGGGFTIDRPGNWCLGENILITQPISIEVSDVSFDLKGRIIHSDAAASSIVGIVEVKNVTIKNGTIIANDLGGNPINRFGVRTVVAENSLIEDISVAFLGSVDDDSVSQQNIAFVSDGNATFRNCFATGPFLTGFNVEGPNISFFNCEVTHFSGDLRSGGTETRAGIGYIINGNDHYLENCISIGGEAQPDSSSAGSTGFYILSSNTLLHSCTALNHRNPAQTPTTGIPAGYGFYIEGDNCQIINGDATNNALDGILIDANKVLLDTCSTVTNGGSGVHILSGENSIIRNCDASYNSIRGMNINGSNVLIEDCTVSLNIGDPASQSGLFLGVGSGATIRNCVCNFNPIHGIVVNTAYDHVTIENCTANRNGFSGISVNGNPDGVNAFISNCTAQHNGTWGIIVGRTNPLDAEYVALGTYEIMNDQDIRLSQNTAQGNGSRDYIMVLNITDPLGVQPTILGTPRLVSPTVGISANARGALDWDTTGGSSLAVGVIPLSPGIGASVQFSN